MKSSRLSSDVADGVGRPVAENGEKIAPYYKKTEAV